MKDSHVTMLYKLPANFNQKLLQRIIIYNKMYNIKDNMITTTLGTSRTETGWHGSQKGSTAKAKKQDEARWPKRIKKKLTLLTMWRIFRMICKIHLTDQSC